MKRCEWEYSREIWEIEWQYVTDDYIMSDTEILLAYDEDDAIRQYFQIDDIPEGAEIVKIHCDALEEREERYA